MATESLGRPPARRHGAGSRTVMLMAQTPHAFLRHVVPNPPFDEIRDFPPIATVASSDFVRVVNPALKERSLP